MCKKTAWDFTKNKNKIKMVRTTKKINGMKLYKVISRNGMAQNGGSFDYKHYLPKKNKAGKWTPEVKAIKCESGYHVTNYWNMWIKSESDLIFEVECKNILKESVIGVNDKYVCESIRFIKQVKLSFDTNCNTGDYNTGDYNTGDRNTGDWNMCDDETGMFNTINKNTIRVFNKEIDRNVWDNCIKPSFIYFDLVGDYKESFINSFNKTDKNDVELLIKLPNFNYDVFEEISGITKRMIDKKLRGK